MYIVNIEKLVVPMACVAAITLSLTACAAGPDVFSLTPSPSQTPSQESTATYDEWKNWTNGDALVGFEDLSALVGVDAIMYPYQSYVDDGFIGVSKLGTSCIVAFSTIGADTANGNSVSIAVLSRFDESLTEAVADVAIEEVKSLLETYRARPECKTTPPDVGTTT